MVDRRMKKELRAQSKSKKNANNVLTKQNVLISVTGKSVAPLIGNVRSPRGTN